MEKWQTIVKLKLKGFFRTSVRFSFEWKAWLLAYDLYSCSPGDFSKLDIDDQFSALCYGAAAWDLIKRKKGVFFTYEDMKKALLNASKADNQKLARVLKSAQFPQWLRSRQEEEDDKKKEASQ